MSEFLTVPDGAKRIVPHAKFVANVPPGLTVEAFEYGGGQMVHAVVLPVLHCDVIADATMLSMPDVEFKERILGPMLDNLGEYAKWKTGSEQSAPVAASVEPILQFFEFGRLPPHLAAVSGKFYDVACHVMATLPRNPERTVVLRKLLEAKDAAVRAGAHRRTA